MLSLNEPEVDGAGSVGAAVAAGADVAAGAAVAAGADVAAGAAVVAATAVGSGVAVAEAPQATISNRAPTIAMRIPNRRFLNHLALANIIFSHLSEMRQNLVVEEFIA